MDRSNILTLLKQFKETKAEKYHIRKIGIFGSIAKDTAVPGSDIDVVVELSKPDLFMLVHLKEELEELFKTKVDVIRRRPRMNPYLKKRIEKETIYV